MEENEVETNKIVTVPTVPDYIRGNELVLIKKSFSFTM